MKKILLPIKPPYVHRILNGEKKVEYRKRIASQKDISQVLIYASHPVCRVVGEFRIAGILCDTPDKLWEKTACVGSINRSDYFAYFVNHSIAYAYQIEDVKTFNVPRTLSDYGLKRAPQNFVYVEDDD